MILKIQNDLVNISTVEAICAYGEKGLLIHTHSHEYTYKFTSEKERDAVMEKMEKLWSGICSIHEVAPKKIDELADIPSAYY
jgi:hypothetical protein